MMISLAVLAATPYWRGADMSFIPQYRDLKAKFFVGAKETDALVAIRNAGVNMLRLRVWVAPEDGYYDSGHTAAMAREAKKLGMEVMIDFHYSNTWADPAKQTMPRGWQGFDIEDVSKILEQHTFDVLSIVRNEGVNPKIVAIGNEVRDGMVWPMGQISKNGVAPFARLLKAGIKGAKRALKKPFQIMIHNDAGGDKKGCDWFYSALKSEGVGFDCIGLSYYPWWHGTFGQLKENLDNLAIKFKVPVIVTETAYPFSLEGRDKTGNFVWEKTDLKTEYPATPEGQVAFLKKLHSVVKSTPNGLGQGVLYWAPEYVAHPGIQTPCENLCLFDFSNRILPGAKALGERQ